MANNYFQFKQFKIEQSQCAMKVGTDGVVLGILAPVDKADNILDIGTGTGLIAIMLAQRASGKAMIDAIEIDELASTQAIENAQNSPWSINIICDDFNSYATNCSVKYDLIVSNPPYFVNSLKAPTANRNLARHTDSLSFNDLFSGVKALLSTKGVFYIIFPSQEKNNILTIAANAGLYLNHEISIYPKPESEVKRYVMGFSNTDSDILRSNLTIEIDRHKYSDDFKQLTKDFYLR